MATVTRARYVIKGTECGPAGGRFTPMLPRSVLVAFLALLVCAGTAQASSIVFIKDYDVWLANPDGTGQRPVTTDGFKEAPYEYPSQSDDGTILAARGTRFVKLDRNGNRIGEPLPSVLYGKPANVYAVGPFDPEISPDGHKLVYWIGTWSTWFDYGSNITWTDPQDAVIWQNADSGAQLGFTMFYQEPSWLPDSQHALLNQPANRNAPQVGVAAIGADHNDVGHVFSDHDSLPPGETYSLDVGDAEATRAGDKLVALRGFGGETIRFYDLRGDVPVVSPCYLGEPVGGSAAGPTWAPDGSAVAWSEGDGIWSTPVGALDSTDCSWGAPRLIIPGGTMPDWGPAGLGTGPAPPDPGKPDPAKPGPAAPAPLAVQVPGSMKRGALLRRGVKVTVTAPQAGTAAATLRAGRKVVARRSQPVAANAATVLTLKPRAKQARRIRRARTLKLRVAVGPQVQTRMIALRR
jgi:hypothetical protein